MPLALSKLTPNTAPSTGSPIQLLLQHSSKYLQKTQATGLQAAPATPEVRALY
jgi:hypothetical protein